MKTLKFTLAQTSCSVGHPLHNVPSLLADIKAAKAKKSDLIIFPECILTGYPPEDLLFSDAWPYYIEDALAELAKASMHIDILIGTPYFEQGLIFNAAVHLQKGQIVQIIKKRCLPNHGVFDERRYFTPGNQAGLITVKGHPFGVLICEDAWQAAPALDCVKAGAKALIQINASPFEQDKHLKRLEAAKQRVLETNLPLISVYAVGAQDELVFDGGSFILNQIGECCFQAPFFNTYSHNHTFDIHSGLQPESCDLPPSQSALEQLYQALVTALRAYLSGCGIQSVLIGLSGGIDSALTLALAVDALGAEAVTAVRLPSRYTSELSMRLAEEQVHAMHVDCLTLPIDLCHEASIQTLSGWAPLSSITDQNLQSRARGQLLMALSNQTGAVVLTTGNKSELAMGYATLYGDTIGAYALLKDLYKTEVYALAHYRNSLLPVIPEEVLSRPPTAELKPDQTDQDTLPNYATLDAILKRHIEHHESAETIIAEGFDKQTVQTVLKTVRQNEYKRRQAPPGPKVSAVSFGKDWRMPICQKVR